MAGAGSRRSSACGPTRCGHQHKCAANPWFAVNGDAAGNKGRRQEGIERNHQRQQAARLLCSPCHATPPRCSQSRASLSSFGAVVELHAANTIRRQRSAIRAPPPCACPPFSSSGQVGRATRTSTSPPPEHGGLLFLLRERGGLHRSWPPPAAAYASSNSAAAAKLFDEMPVAAAGSMHARTHHC